MYKPLLSLALFTFSLPAFSVAQTGAPLPYEVLTTLNNGTEVRNGGYGSAATAHPTEKNQFYALTDRGPNAKYTGSAGKGKKFPVPGYNPRIGLFALQEDGSITHLRDIILRNPKGEPLTGLPNPEGKGATGEIPYDNAGNLLQFDPYGIDGEGLVALPNGDFWVSDEYGPHLIHFDSEGRELERISPLGVDTGSRKLPAVFKRRRPNRGMEGLAVTPGGKELVGIMQSTLFNPSKKEVTNTQLTRMLFFNLADASTQQYLYLQEKPWNANSEIVALSATTFLVVERDGKFSGKETAQKHIYFVDIEGATDVSGSFDALGGMVVDGKTLEQLDETALAAAGIQPVRKSLALDLVESLPNRYPHDKLEGFWLIDDKHIGVINDDDFAVVATKSGEVKQKLLPGIDIVDASTLYLLDLP